MARHSGRKDTVHPDRRRGRVASPQTAGKPTVGISACLLGQCVRYDGGHKLNRSLRDGMRMRVEWIPVCPETECGFGIPRATVRLVGNAADPRLVTTETLRDRTAAITAWTKRKIAQLRKKAICGFVFKARSPSCAIHDCALYDRRGLIVGTTAGIFARGVMWTMPTLPIIDEEAWRDPKVRRRFLELVERAGPRRAPKDTTSRDKT